MILNKGIDRFCFVLETTTAASAWRVPVRRNYRASTGDIPAVAARVPGELALGPGLGTEGSCICMKALRIRVGSLLR